MERGVGLENCQYFMIPLLPLYGTVQCGPRPQTYGCRETNDSLKHMLSLNLLAHNSAPTNLPFPDLKLRLNKRDNQGARLQELHDRSEYFGQGNEGDINDDKVHRGRNQ
jgi:hypothetical protein